MKTLILTTALKAAITSVILITLLLTGFSLSAAESEPSAKIPEPSAEPPTNNAPGNANTRPQVNTVVEQSTKPDNEQPSTNEQLPTTAPPQAENLKNRELGAAFRQFRPSEEISADNAVPFPVDI